MLSHQNDSYDSKSVFQLRRYAFLNRLNATVLVAYFYTPLKKRASTLYSHSNVYAHFL